jgi:hypothetical protein
MEKADDKQLIICEPQGISTRDFFAEKSKKKTGEFQKFIFRLLWLWRRKGLPFPRQQMNPRRLLS